MFLAFPEVALRAAIAKYFRREPRTRGKKVVPSRLILAVDLFASRALMAEIPTICQEKSKIPY